MTQASLPFGGRTPTARACSMKGAIYAAAHRGEKAEIVRVTIVRAGSHGVTRHDVRGLTGIETSSLCSIIAALVESGLVREAGSRPSGPYGKDCVIYVGREVTP